MAIAVLVAACLSTLLWGATAIFNGDDEDVMLGGVFLAVPSAVAAILAWLVQRALRERRSTGAPAPPLQATGLPSSSAPSGLELPGVSAQQEGSGQGPLIAGAVALVAVVGLVIVMLVA